MTKWDETVTGVDPASHKTRHQDAGADEVSVTGLSGLLADDQHVLDAEVQTVVDASTYSRIFLTNAFQYPNSGTDWTPTASGAHLGVGLSAKKVWLPLNFLKVGDIITTYNLVGDAIISGTSTLDCKLVRLNKADPLTTTDLTNGAITQITANGNFDSTANVDDETMATDKQYYLEITGTTDAADEFYIIGVEITVTRLI